MRKQDLLESFSKLNLSQNTLDSYKTQEFKGYFAKPLSLAHHVAMISTELSEIIEADRKNSHWDNYKFRGVESELMYNFNHYLKGTVEEEFADVIIRIMTFIYSEYGLLNNEHFSVVVAEVIEKNSVKLNFIVQLKITEFVYCCNKVLYSEHLELEELILVILYCINYSLNKFDINFVVDTKLKVNRMTEPKVY